MENAAQMVTVSEFVIYKSLKKENLGFLCYCACLCIIFTYFGTKHGICAPIGLVEYKYEYKLVFQT